jgi:hypothetical protein
MGRKPRNPVIEFEGERFTRLHSGFYAGYYRMTREPRTMLHRFAYLKHHGPIKRGHDVIYMDGSRENVAADNLLMVTRPKRGTLSAHRLHKLEIKRCLACDQPMGRRVGWIRGSVLRPMLSARPVIHNVQHSGRRASGAARGCRARTSCGRGVSQSQP